MAVQRAHRARRVVVVRGLEISRFSSRSRRMKTMSSLVLAARSMPSAISRNRSRCSLAGALGAQPGRAAAPARGAPPAPATACAGRLGDEDALARQDRHEALAREPLQRLADGRAADLQARRQRVLGRNSPGLSRSVTICSSSAVGLLRQRLGARPPRLRALRAERACRTGWPVIAPRQICLRLATMAANFSYSSSLTV